MKKYIFILSVIFLAWVAIPAAVQAEYYTPEEILFLELFGEDFATEEETTGSESMADTTTDDESAADDTATAEADEITAQDLLDSAQQRRLERQQNADLHQAAPTGDLPTDRELQRMMNRMSSDITHQPKPALTAAYVPAKQGRPLTGTGAGAAVGLIAVGGAILWTLKRASKSERKVITK